VQSKTKQQRIVRSFTDFTERSAETGVRKSCGSRAAQATVRKAQFVIDAARAEHYRPSVVVQADYGDIGSMRADCYSWRGRRVLG
jgi:prophage tail gpP-like protein